MGCRNWTGFSSDNGAEEIEAPAPVDLKRYFKKAELSNAQWDLYIKLNQMIRKITEDSERMQFNTTIAAMMEYFNSLNQVKRIKADFYQYLIQKSLQLISPLAPHFAEELWGHCGYEDSIFKSSWPVYDPDAVISDQITIAVQINGKLRDQLTVASDASKDEIEKIAKASEKIIKQLQGKTIVKVIHVPGRLINLVAK